MRPALAFLAVLATPLAAEEVGRVGVDWVGNDIIVEALEDPEVEGVTCHVSFFERSAFDRITGGNWFEDPSNSSIACRQTGPLLIGDIARGEEGEEIFSERQSIILKSLRVTRILDEEHQVLIYLSHASEVSEGSAKMSISTIPLWGQDVAWE